MTTQSFSLKPYPGNGLAGHFPFRVAAERNATDVSHIPAVQQRSQLASDVNRALDYYQEIGIGAIRCDNDHFDTNSQRGICARPLSMKGKDYEVYVDFTPSASVPQPMTKTQIRFSGKTHNLLDYSQDINGKLTLTMLDPFSSRVLMLAREAGKELTVSTKPC